MTPGILRRRSGPALFFAAGVWCFATSALAACDRACLRGGLDRYLAAMTGHQPGAAGLAPGFRATENGVVVAPGDGLWKSATGFGALQRRYFDETGSQAAFYGLIEEAGAPAVAILRLKFAGRRVVESEAVVARKGDRLYDPGGVLRNPPAPDEPSSTAKAPSSKTRAALVAAATSYLDAMQSHSSAGLSQSPGCVRLESGAGGKGAGSEPPHDCLSGLDRLTQIARVAHRRYDVVDEQAGAVVATLMFLRPPGALTPNGQPWKRNLLMDVFTARDGALSGVFGATHYLEADAPETTGWPDGR